MSVTVPVVLDLNAKYPQRWGFEYPFKRNHCAVSAWTHLVNGDAEYARQLADRARAAGLLSARGYAQWEREDRWAALVGLRVVRFERATQRSTTLTTFAKQHPRGRFLVAVRGHFVAVIEGRIFGSWRPRSRVTYYVEVEG